MKRFLLALSLLLLFAVPAFAFETRLQLGSDCPIDLEVQSLYNIDNITRHIWYFTNVIGPRQGGTHQERQIAEKVAGIFRSYGIEDIRFDRLGRSVTGELPIRTWTLPCLTIHDHYDPAAAEFGWPTTFDKGVPVGRGNLGDNLFINPNLPTVTGHDGVTGYIVYFGYGKADLPPEMAGNIALIRTNLRHQGQAFHNPFPAEILEEIRTAYARAVEAGAAAVLFIANEPDSPGGQTSGTFPPPHIHHLQEYGYVAPPGARPCGWSPSGNEGVPAWANFTIPGATVAWGVIPDYVVPDLLTRPNTRVTYRVAQFQHLYNVIATIPPSDNRADADIVMFIAHIDSVTATPGSQDNATGTAAILEHARVFQILRDQGKLDKEIVIAAVGAEEGGISSTFAGSFKIARGLPNSGFCLVANPGRRDRIIAVFNHDSPAPSDPWNAAFTFTLRQHFGLGNVPPREDCLVHVNSRDAAVRFGLPVVPLDERNMTGDFAFKLTTGGGSDHAPFGEVRSERHPHGIPNANHSIRGSMGLDPAANNSALQYAAHAGPWNVTAPLESRYHTAGDRFEYAYCPLRMEIVIKVTGASAFRIARVSE